MSPVGHEIGTDNVFADIGTPAPEEHLLKAKLVFEIDVLLRKRGLKQVEAAALFGVKRADVSRLRHGEFRHFSVERLLGFLNALGHDVEIVVKPRSVRTSTVLQVA